MMRVIACVATLHNLWLVGLAALICVAGAVVTFELLSRARQRQGVQRTGWLFLSSVAAGSAVWCTHFIAMLAYEAAAPVTFDPLLTMASLLIVIVGSALAFLALGHKHIWTAGILLGLAISAMHYVGMLAYRVDGLVEWDISYLVGSVLIAMVFGAASMKLVSIGHKPGAIVTFILSVVGLHFTGMTAVSVTPFITGAPIAGSVAMSAMAVAVAGVSLLIVGTGVAAYMIDSDVTERNLDHLRRMALSDALTGLPNRSSYSDHLDRQIERAAREGNKLAIVGIDLDKFKEINDLRGHDAGDSALRAIADRLSGILRKNEFVARIGGDEFAAIKPFLVQRELDDFLVRIERELFAPITLDDYEVVTGASIGVSVYPEDGLTAARLIGNSDLAMYRAKADVTRAVCYFEPEMDEVARARRNLSIDLRGAIEKDELSLHYQVQTSVVEPSRVVGYEVLLRWNHPQRGEVPPSEFIPLAEETGSIIAIGEWVLRSACREAAKWTGSEKIAVNISPVQLSQSDLPRIVHQILLETGLPASRLELEITESSIIQDKVRSLHALRAIRALGVTIAIDDFGTGYSSLDTLRSFPFDRIKLDRSFMKEVEDSAQARAIIRAVLALGKSLEISVLAEGVETERQLTLLEEEGCDEAQGYLLGRPGPVAAAPHRVSSAVKAA